MAAEGITQFAAKAFKSGKEVIENRGRPDPSMITSMLMTMLRQIGEDADLPAIKKRIQDDCMWSEGATAPWRRSPYYLIVSPLLSHMLRKLD